MDLRVGHLYPDLMNIYGDKGNVIALAQRARWRGVEVAYSVHRESHVLHLDRVLLICGPVTDDDCLGEPFSTPR